LALLDASWSSETGKDLKDFLHELFHQLSNQDLDFLDKVYEELAQIKKPKDITSDTLKIILRLKLGIYGCD
jgi:DNA-binding transcriptional regulator PaaX